MRLRSLAGVLLFANLLPTFAADARTRAVTPPPPNAFQLEWPYGSIVAGPDGHVWIWAPDTLNRVLDTGALEVVARGLPYANSLIRGVDGAIWGVHWSFSEPMTSIVRATSDGAVSSVPIRPNTVLQLAPGQDGRVWFTEGIKDRIGTTTAAGPAQEIALEPQSDGPQAASAAPDSSIWFVCRRRIGHVRPSGELEWFPIDAFFVPPESFLPRAADSQFNSIAVTSDGTVWLAIGSEYEIGFAVPGGEIVRMSSTGQLRVVSERGVSRFPSRLTVGPDGALWFVDAKAVRYNPATYRIVRLALDGTETDFDLPPRPLADRYTGVDGFAFDIAGSLWVLAETNDGHTSLLKFEGAAVQ